MIYCTNQTLRASHVFQLFCETLLSKIKILFASSSRSVVYKYREKRETPESKSKKELKKKAFAKIDKIKATRQIIQFFAHKTRQCMLSK